MLVMTGAAVSMMMALLAARVVPATVSEAVLPAASRASGWCPSRQLWAGGMRARSAEMSPAWTV